jgi:tetratricopeptide (TPR) repeat protein
VLLATAAVTVTAADLTAWSWLQHLRLVAPTDPTAVVRRLHDSPLMLLPSAVQRSRSFPSSELGAAPRALLTAALERLGELQCRWIPGHPSGQTNLARGDLLSGRVHEAEARLEEAMMRDPTSPRLHRLLGVVLLLQGRVETSLEELAVAEAIAPGIRSPPVELIAEHARRVRLRGLELRNEYYPRRRVENALALARATRADGDSAGARQRVAAYKDDPEVRLELARWAFEDGERATTLALLEGITENRAYSRALRSRAWALIALVREADGDRTAALAAAHQALALDPDSPSRWVTLAHLAESRGEIELALDHLRRAWGMSPADIGLLIRIARVAEQAGRPADAVLALERAVEIDPGSAGLAARLVSLQIRQGRLAEAAMTLSRALDRHPTDPTLLELTDRLRREVGSARN